MDQPDSERQANSQRRAKVEYVQKEKQKQKLVL